MTGDFATTGRRVGLSVTDRPMREAGMLVLVFGLLDYFLGGRKQGPAWPWLCAAIGVILMLMGAAAETAFQQGEHR